MAASPYLFAEIERPQDPADTAELLLEQARVDAERIRTEARAETIAAVRAEIRPELEAQLALAAAAAAAAQRWQEQVESRFAAEACELALAVAEKIVAAKIEIDASVLESVLCDALRRARDRRNLTLTVNPTDLDAARELLPSLRAAFGADEITLVDDRRIARGGCLLDTPAGEIDATVASKFERIREAIRKAETR